jgi:hypothetical protein|tara:strand:- start:1397 stop:1717 length:321 start_codon:yes stop_codon:yes gene_type:complete
MNIKDLQTIIKIQERVIKAQNTILETKDKTHKREIDDFEWVLERNNKSSAKMFSDNMYWRDMTTYFYRRWADLGFKDPRVKKKIEIKKKGKKTNVEKKTKRGTKSK